MAADTAKPRIGITMDHETKQTYSKYPWYALRENYAGSISEMGGVPIPLPHELALMDVYAGMIDGLIITGGDFDVSPELYGQATISDTVSVKDRRTQFEYGMTQRAMQQSLPILAICGGQQLLNVVLGGTLIQHIPDSVTSDIEHEQPNPRNEVSHSVTIEAKTQLAAIVGAEEIKVNSAHHQAVDQPGEGVIVNAVAPDGIIEGIEYPMHPFCLGLQWHPEFLITEADRDIYRAFMHACRG